MVARHQKATEMRWSGDHTAQTTAILMFKTKRKLQIISPIYSRAAHNDCDLRGKENRLLLPKFRTEFAKRNCFSPTGAKVWNSTPFNVRSVSSLFFFERIITISLLFNLQLWETFYFSTSYLYNFVYIFISSVCNLQGIMWNILL